MGRCSEWPDFGPGLDRHPSMGVLRSTAQTHPAKELVEVLGAKVAQQSMRWAEITHIVCAMPELMDRKQYDAACRKDIPVVTVQWLFDCFNLNVRQAEERYAIGGLLGKMESQGKSAEVVSQQTVDVAPASFAVDVLSGHDVFVSPSALGSDERLPQMAEELGAKVRRRLSASSVLSTREVDHGVRHGRPLGVARSFGRNCALATRMFTRLGASEAGLGEEDDSWAVAPVCPSSRAARDPQSWPLAQDPS